MMKRQILIFGSMLISCLSFAQAGNDTTTNKEKKWNSSVYVATGCSYRTIQGKYVSFNEGSFGISYESKFDIPKPGFIIGFNFRKISRKKFGITLGVMFENYGYKTKLIDTLYVFDRVDPSSGLINKLPNRRIKINEYFISFPVTFEYKFYSTNRSVYYFDGGLAVNYLFSEIESREKTFESVVGRYKTQSDLLIVFATIHLGISLPNKIGNHTFSFGPILNYALFPVTENTGIKNSPYQKHPIGSRYLFFLGVVLDFKIK